MADGFGLWLFDDQLEQVLRLTQPDSRMKFGGIQSAWNSNLWISGRFEPDTKAIVLYRPEGNDPRRVMLEHPDEVFTAVFTLDDRHVITSCRDGIVRFWRTSDGGLEKSVAIHDVGEGWVREISPDGQTALLIRLTKLEQAFFHCVDLESGKVFGDSHSLPAVLVYARFSPDGKQLTLADFMGSVTVLEARTGRMISSSKSQDVPLRIR